MVQKSSRQSDLFGRLKHRFVFNAAFMSLIVIVIAFSAVYVAISNSFDSRHVVDINFRFDGDEVLSDAPAQPDSSDAPTQPDNSNTPAQPDNSNAPTPSDTSSNDDTSRRTAISDLNQQVRDLFNEKIQADRAKSLETLLFTLIITGASIEAIVIIASLWAAENSIKPVREAYENQKTFISNASHELKTPLAVIQANLEAADIEGNQWIDNAQAKVDDAIELNNNLLSLARMDQVSAEPAKKVSVNLSNLVQKTASFYEPKMNEKSITLNFGQLEVKNSEKSPNSRKNAGSEHSPNSRNSEPETILAPRAELTQLLNILIDNAVKYAKSNIEINTSRNVIKITNDGATVSKEQLKHIFERFYQTDKTKSGVGLGLSIAKAIADRNHWKLTATSDATTTTFTLELPEK